LRKEKACENDPEDDDEDEAAAELARGGLYEAGFVEEEEAPVPKTS